MFHLLTDYAFTQPQTFMLAYHLLLYQGVTVSLCNAQRAQRAQNAFQTCGMHLMLLKRCFHAGAQRSPPRLGVM